MWPCSEWSGPGARSFSSSQARRPARNSSTFTARPSRLRTADGVRAPRVMHAAAANERHGTGFQPPPVGGAGVSVAVVADAHVVGGMVDEAQRLGAARRIAVNVLDEGGSGEKQALRGRGDQLGKPVQFVRGAEGAVGA